MIIDTDLVTALVSEQFPKWRDLKVRPVDHDGWDNRTFRLGDTMSVRLPSALGYVGQVEKEHRWLPWLAPRLPLPVPAPVALGEPGADYPYPWSVYRWIEGGIATSARLDDRLRFARDLAGFLTILFSLDATDGPVPDRHNGFRGEHPGFYDAETRVALEALGGHIDVEKATGVWDAAVASRWQGPPIWCHGDIASGNLLVREGKLAAVIDFGCSAVGDPSCDLSIAWTMFDADTRAVFARELALDDGTWARARGWTLWKALITAVPEMAMPAEARSECWTVIDRVLADPVQVGPGGWPGRG